MSAAAHLRAAIEAGALFRIEDGRIHVTPPLGGMPLGMVERLSTERECVRELLVRQQQFDRLRRLGRLAGCPMRLIDRLHPKELAEYAAYPDAEAVESLRHLSTCAECQARQFRRVTCGSCANFITNKASPEAGIGMCSASPKGTGPPLVPDAKRHCREWVQISKEQERST